MEKQAKNGTDVLDDIMKRVQEVGLIQNTKVAEGTPPASTDAMPEDHMKLAELLKAAAGQLGDGKSDSPTAQSAKNDGDTPPNYSSDQVADSQKSWGLSENIKSAVLASLKIVDEKVASVQGATRKAMTIGLPLAALAGGGAGYAVGRNVDRKQDRKANSAYYQAGVYDAAKALVRQMREQARGGSNGK